MPADVNLASAGFFVLLRVVTRLSLGEWLPTLFHLREQDVGSLRLHRHDRSEGARRSGRHLSPPPSALAKPVGGWPAQHTSQRRSATPFRHQRRECPLAREEPNENGREGAKSRELSSENAEKITANAGLSPDCVAYIVCAQAVLVRRSRRQEKTVRSLPLKEKSGPVFIGTLRTTAADFRG